MCGGGDKTAHLQLQQSGALNPTCGQSYPGTLHSSQLKPLYSPETEILCSCADRQPLIQVWYLPQTVGVSLTVTIDTKKERTAHTENGTPSVSEFVGM